MAQATKFELSTQDYVVAECAMLDNAAVTTQVFFIAPEPMKVVEIHEIHGTKGTGGGTVTLTVKRCQGTEASTAGDDLLGTTKINLKGDNNTLQSPDLTATTDDLTLAAGDRLSVDTSGTLTSVAGALVQVLLARA